MVMTAESSQSNPDTERDIWNPTNLKSTVWKYFGFLSVDGKIVEPWDRVVCKLLKPTVPALATWQWKKMLNQLIQFDIFFFMYASVLGVLA